MHPQNLLRPRSILLVWLLANFIFGTYHVVSSLEHAAEIQDPEQYVHTVGFQVFAYLFVYGLPSLLVLGAAIGLSLKYSEPDKQQGTTSVSRSTR